MLNAQGRPPFFLALLGLSFAAFGNSPIVGHSVVLVFSFLGVLFTYLLGTHLFNQKVGLLAAFFLFLSPLYFAQSGITNYAVPLTALSVMTVYFALNENIKAYLITASCLVLTKETGLLILPPILIVLFIRYLNKPEKKTELFLYLLPLVPYLIWLVACKIHLGWYLFPSHVGLANSYAFKTLLITFLHKTAQLFLQNTWKFAYGRLYLPDSFGEFLLQSYHLPLTLLIIFTLRKWLHDIHHLKEHIILILSGITVYLVFFSIYTVPLDRYLLPIYPFFYLLSAASIDQLHRIKIAHHLLPTVFILCVFIANWTGYRSGFGFELETNLEYLDFLHVHQKAAKFIENNYSDKRVLTAWPQTMELRYPFEGYVTRPIQTYSISEPYDLADIDLVYFVPKSTGVFQELLNQLDLVQVARFDQNNKTAIIYELQSPRKKFSRY
jgi:4-amino-4-deoxy-L-arabinose transferase-like glycosyltransferase